MKRNLRIILTLAALITVLGCGAALAAVTSGPLNDEGTVSYENDGSTVRISGTGATKDYGSSYNLSPLDSKSMTAAVIEAGVTRLGSNLFYGCTNLTAVTIMNPDTVISDTAFRQCSGLAAIYGWPDSTAAAYAAANGYAFRALDVSSGSCGAGVTWILVSDTGVLTISGTGPMADYDISSNLSPFASNTDIHTVMVQEGVTAIGNAAFYSCSGITDVSLPESTALIGEQAFRSCAGLSHITLPDGLDSIGTGAFSFCRGLTGITLPDSLTGIGTGAFANCSGLTSVSFKNPDTVIGENAFTGTNASLTIYGMPGSTAAACAAANGYAFRSLAEAPGCCGADMTWAFDAGTGVLTIRGTGEMADYSSESPAPWKEYLESITSVSIGSGVTHIGNIAFAACSGLTSVTIPDGVTGIGSSAFAGCSSLTGIAIPNSVTGIGAYAFSHCSSLIGITLPNSLTAIGKNTFEFCTNLTGISIPGSVTAIGMEAFQSCTHLARITIPDSVTSIGDRAFIACSGLKSLDIGSSVAYIGKWAFESCTSLTSVIFPQSVAVIDDRAFAYCSNLAHITLYNRDVRIKSAFSDTALPDDGAVHGWSGSTAQTFAEGNGWKFEPLGSTSGSCGTNVTWTFDAASGVLTISGTGAMTDYSEYTDVPWRAHRYAVKSVVIGDGVTSLGDFAFLLQNSVLTSVSIPNSVTRIGRSAFAECTGLTAVSIPAGVTAIGDYSLYDCTNLSRVYVLSPDAAIGEEVFGSCPNLTIHCHAGSTAHEWAYNKNVPFSFLADLNGSCGTNVTWAFDPGTGTLTISGTGAMNSYTGTNVPWYSYRESITTLSIGDGVTAIGDRAFAGCTGLTDVTVPRSVAQIGKQAFQGCTALADAAVQHPDCRIGDSSYDVFTGCAVNLTLRGWTASTAAAYAANPASPCSFGLLAPAPSFFLPAALTAVETGAFMGVPAQAVVIPKTVTSIEGNPFSNISVICIYGFPGTAAETLAQTYPTRFRFIPLTDAWYARLTD